MLIMFCPESLSPRLPCKKTKIVQCTVFVCTWNCVTHIERNTQAEGVREQAGEAGVWAYAGGNNTLWRKLRIERLYDLC